MAVNDLKSFLSQWLLFCRLEFLFIYYATTNYFFLTFVLHGKLFQFLKLLLHPWYVKKKILDATKKVFRYTWGTKCT